MVDREHNGILAKRLERAVEWFVRERSGRRDGDVTAEKLGRLDRHALGEGLRPLVEAPEKKGQCLTHVAEQQLCLGEAVEHAAEDDAQGMRCRLSRPAPRRTVQFRASGIGRWHHGRIGRMEIDRRVERFGSLPKRAEPVIVEVQAVGLADDHRYLHP